MVETGFIDYWRTDACFFLPLFWCQLLILWLCVGSIMPPIVSSSGDHFGSTLPQIFSTPGIKETVLSFCTSPHYWRVAEPVDFCLAPTPFFTKFLLWLNAATVNVQCQCICIHDLKIFVYR
jgi:hypothetical protein